MFAPPLHTKLFYHINDGSATNEKQVVKKK
jgi:hypothetical protein